MTHDQWLTCTVQGPIPRIFVSISMSSSSDASINFLGVISPLTKACAKPTAVFCYKMPDTL